MPRSVTRAARRRRTALSVGVAVTALGLGLAVPSQAADRDTGPRSIPAPAQIREQLQRELARSAATSAGVSAFGGFGPVPGSTVSTDLPTRLEIGSSDLGVVYRVSVSGSTAGYQQPVGAIALADADSGEDNPFVAVVATDLAPGQKAFSGQFVVRSSSVTALGAGSWVAGIGDDSADEDAGSQFGVRPVVVKLHSLLGQQVTRHGGTVEVFGSAKAYDQTGDTYVPRVGLRVAVQRYTSTGWRTVVLLRADRNGHVSTALHLPYRVALRLTDADTGTVFGAVTTAAVL